MEDIRTRPATNQYREGWDRTFGNEATRASGVDNGHALATHAQAPLQAMRVQPGPPAKGDGPALFPYDIQCPHCGAAPGEKCVRVLDRAPMRFAHAARSEQ